MIGATEATGPLLHLAELPVGAPATIIEIRGGRQSTRRDLGGGVVDKIWVRRLEQAD